MIEKQEGKDWIKVFDDKDWSTIFHWERSGISYSKSSITWQIPSNMTAGKYRIRHFGYYKNGWNGKIYPYVGVSNVFHVISQVK